MKINKLALKEAFCNQLKKNVLEEGPRIRRNCSCWGVSYFLKLSGHEEVFSALLQTYGGVSAS